MASETLNIKPFRDGNTEATRVVVQARPGWRAIDLAELWHYRELLWILASRDLKVRYKQTVLGVLWAFIPPLFTMLIFNIIFTVLLKVDPVTLSNGIPYPIFSFSALVPWGLFASSLSRSGNSLVGGQNLITKVYFPRLVIPMSSIIGSIVDCLIALSVVGGMMIYYRHSITVGWPLLTLPLFLLMAVAAALAVGLWLSALNVQYRDVGLVMPIIVQLWMYATPVIYASQRVPAAWRTLYNLNPMVGVIEGCRWALLGDVQPAPDGPMLVASLASIVALLVSGLFYFRRMEKTFADLV